MDFEDVVVSQIHRCIEAVNQGNAGTLNNSIDALEILLSPWITKEIKEEGLDRLKFLVDLAAAKFSFAEEEMVGGVYEPFQ